MRRPLLLALALALAGCGGDGEGVEEPPPSAGTAPAATGPPPGQDAGGERLSFAEAEEVALGLEAPWELDFAPGGVLLVTERSGRVRVVEEGGLRERPAAGIDVVAEGEGGLLGLALHPDFARERFAYLYFTARDGNRVSRYPVADDWSLGDEEVLLRGIPSARLHNGGRIAFGPDGMLYAGTGDAGSPELAADPGSLAGKILRLSPDGSVPADNPVGGSPVYATGLRNVQGLAWDDEGRLLASSHGPSGEFGLCCLDELNLIEPGADYGWPALAGAVETGAGAPPPDAVAPLADSGAGDTWAPSGIAWAEGSVLMANLRGEALLRFRLSGDGASVEEQDVAVDGLGRLRSVRVGPDGCAYVLTSNRDGRGTPRPGDDRILRLCERPAR
jgi:glucose/arabinose dehydrogenase